MSVFRVEKNRNYTTMSNYHLRDTELSLKAIGLLSKILSLPDDWDYSIAGLAAICKEGETAVKSALSELKVHGYVVVNKITPAQSGTGRIAYEYVVYEVPQGNQEEGQLQEVIESWTDDRSLQKALCDFVKMREWLGKPLSVDRLTSELGRLIGYEPNVQLQMVKQSLRKKWLKFYAVKK